jgi:hypothetical protein
MECTILCPVLMRKHDFSLIQQLLISLVISRSLVRFQQGALESQGVTLNVTAFCFWLRQWVAQKALLKYEIENKIVTFRCDGLFRFTVMLLCYVIRNIP